MDPTAPILAKALRYLSYRSRSEKEVREYLLGKNKPQRRKSSRHSGLSRIDSGFDASASPQNDNLPNLIDVVIARLKEMKFLDDAQFAKSWVRSRTEYKPKSVSVIKMELRQKGISDELIQEALAQRPSEKDDMALAKELLERKKNRYALMDPQERYRKAGSFLARKGFSYEVIKSAIDSVFGKEYNSI